MKKLASIFFAFLFIGCDQIEISKEKNEGKTPTNVGQVEESSPDKAHRIEASSLEEQIKINVKGADPEQYSIQFSWPYLVDEKVLRIRLGSVLAEVLPNQTFFTHILPHNQTVTFSFDVLDKNRKPERTFTKTVRVPTDFVAKPENSVIKENIKIDVKRIFLSDKCPLTTNGFSVDIIADEIHAQNGFIQSLPEKVLVLNPTTNINEEVPPTAQPEKKGRSGGNISITSKKLFGRLVVYMRGEKGGIGPKGDPTNGQMAGQGTPAGIGKNICEYNENGYETQCICHFGSPGGKGLEGAKGKQGKIGMNGGESGNVRISIHEYIPLEGFDPTLPRDGGEVVKVFQLPGAGGKGGPGGDGQRGSPGGPGRDLNNWDDCRGEPGPEGDRGNTGDEGSIGPSGKVGLKCIYVGSENVNECTQ